MTRPLKAHLFDRQAMDWYVEVPWCSRRLFQVEQFVGGVFDPCCGRGNILASALAAGLPCSGSDLVVRAGTAGESVDFFSPRFSMRGFENIVANPPFNSFRQFVVRACELVGWHRKIAMIFPTARLNAARWLQDLPLLQIYFLTPRPSMPPGEMYEALLAEGRSPGQGRTDFCWLVFQSGRLCAPQASWLHRDTPWPASKETA